MDRSTLTVASGDGLFAILKMIESGEEARRIFTTIAECGTNTPGVQAAAIFLPGDKGDSTQELVASYGEFVFDQVVERDQSKVGRMIIHQGISSSHRGPTGLHHYFDVVCLGAPIGSLVAVAPQGLTREAITKLNTLAHHISVVFERQKLSSTLQHFVDRLEVLNELNQLIAANVGLQRIVKSIARESAFRFAADVALSFILVEDKSHLEVKGGYGCAPTLIPEKFAATGGTIGQVMQLGGHLSISNIKNHANHGLEFLEEIGIKSIDICCLEVRGETLGAILIGYRRENVLSQNDLTRFEEFCQGAAVAIANARTQERITAYTERLEELVAQRTADLAVQTSRAEEANKAKSQFLANMSHELRTPLTAIVGYASVLADGIFGPVAEKQRDALNAITRSSEHLKTLIDDVLNLARIESGKEVAEPTRIKMRDVLHQTHKLMMQSALNKGIALQPLNLPAELNDLFVFADAKHLHQVIINLISNAVKYTPAGGKVWLTAERMTDKLRVSVHDTGVGISPTKLARLFQRFERGEDAYSKSQEGTGIGLNLTKHLVELNGGRIGVDSVEGQGSVFWILLPLAESQTVTVTQTEAPIEHGIRLDGLTALVVDDNTDTCEVLRQILQASGATVKVANTVRQGISSIGESIPDIVVTDLAMPGESGLSFIHHVRNASQPVTHVPILVLSACAFPADRDAALVAGANAFLPKPFRPTEVVKQIRQLTLRSAMRDSADGGPT